MATQNTITSNKYKGRTIRSFLLHSGSPAVHQLKTKKQKIGTLTRVTVGENCLRKEHKTILLVGETGAGKSTLINALVNYATGVKFEDNIWFEIVEREETHQTKSQTSDVIVYEIFGFEDETLPFSLTIIDTPGYGDTRGIEHDLTVSQRLLDLFRTEDGVREIDAVGLVMKASDNRLSDRLRYIFGSVVSLFGKDLEENIVILLTHSDGTTPINALKAIEAANIKSPTNRTKKLSYFMFNTQSNTQRTNENMPVLQHAWEISRIGMGQFTQFLKGSRSKMLEKTYEVLNSHIEITSCVNNLQDRLRLIELKQREIQQIQEALKVYEVEMKKNENFTVEVDEVIKVQEPISGGMWGLFFFKGAVCCTVCEENCHYPGCTMASTPKSCGVMKKGRCTVCTRKCPVSVHVKETWRYMITTRTVSKTKMHMKMKYEKNKLESHKKLSLLENLQKEMESLRSQKDRLLEETHKHVISLEENALNVNSVSTYVHLDFLIEKMKEKGDTQKVQKLEEIRTRVDGGTRAALKYFFNSLRK